jgi:hypothetical protein
MPGSESSRCQAVHMPADHHHIGVVIPSKAGSGAAPPASSSHHPVEVWEAICVP